MITARQMILQRLEHVSELTPDVRFGQLIANLVFLASGPWDETLWDLEDEKFLKAIEQHLNDLAKRESTVTVFE